MRTYREDLKECLDRNEGQDEYLSRLMVANTVDCFDFTNEGGKSITLSEDEFEIVCDFIMRCGNWSIDVDLDATPFKACVALNNGLKKLEASGNMSVERIKDVAALGVDYISVGALTHSPKALDISLKFYDLEK